MDREFVTVEMSGEIAIMKLNRPGALNALDTPMLREMRDALKEVNNNRDARVLIITSSVEKAFIAGADIKLMSELEADSAEEFVNRGNKVMNIIEYMPIPVIAAVNGYALGGGTELALACDIVYASERAKFGQPEVKLGIIPGFGGTQRLPRLIGRNKAKELIYTGDVITAQEAKDIGIVNKVCAHETLMDEVMTLAQKITQTGALAIAAAKKAIYDGYHHSLDEGCQIEARSFVHLFGTTDQKEGMKAFIEKRKPNFTGKRSSPQLI